jgi:hypothetical protein
VIYRLRRSAALALTAGLVWFIACSDNDELPSPSSDQGAECEVIGELCHELDTSAAQDCHEQAHHGRCSFASCVKVCVSEGDVEDADPHCAALGELCHPVAEQSDALRNCHELGHVNDAASCAASFDDCATRCLAAREAVEQAASGGAGGNGPEPEHEHPTAGAGGHD